MAVTATPIYAQKVQAWAYQFVNATSTTKEIIAAAGSNGSQVTSITVASTDSAAQNIIFYLYDGSVYHQLCEISIPANSGNTSNTTGPVDVFRNVYAPGLQLDPFGNKVLNIPSGWTLYASMVAAVTSGSHAIDVIAQGGDY